MRVELARSPLLIPRGARSAGGVGGRRIVLALVGTSADGEAEYLITVAGDVSRTYDCVGDLAAVQAFNTALEDAARAGLTSNPEPARVNEDGLRSMRRASGEDAG